MSTYNEEDKRIGYWKLEAFPDHIDRRRCKMIRRRYPHTMRRTRELANGSWRHFQTTSTGRDARCLGGGVHIQ